MSDTNIDVNKPNQTDEYIILCLIWPRIVLIYTVRTVGLLTYIYMYINIYSTDYLNPIPMHIKGIICRLSNSLIWTNVLNHI